jgi:hypothetical protein
MHFPIGPSPPGFAFGPWLRLSRRSLPGQDGLTNMLLSITRCCIEKRPASSPPWLVWRSRQWAPRRSTAARPSVIGGGGGPSPRNLRVASTSSMHGCSAHRRRCMCGECSPMYCCTDSRVRSPRRASPRASRTLRGHAARWPASGLHVAKAAGLLLPRKRPMAAHVPGKSRDLPWDSRRQSGPPSPRHPVQMCRHVWQWRCVTPTGDALDHTLRKVHFEMTFAFANPWPCM